MRQHVPPAYHTSHWLVRINKRHIIQWTYGSTGSLEPAWGIMSLSVACKRYWGRQCQYDRIQWVCHWQVWITQQKDYMSGWNLVPETAQLQGLLVPIHLIQSRLVPAKLLPRYLSPPVALPFQGLPSLRGNGVQYGGRNCHPWTSQAEEGWWWGTWPWGLHWKRCYHPRSAYH